MNFGLQFCSRLTGLCIIPRCHHCCFPVAIVIAAITIILIIIVATVVLTIFTLVLILTAFRVQGWVRQYLQG